MEKSNYKEWSVDFNGKTIKLSIMVNGIVVLQDELSLLDRFVKTFFSKK